MGAEAAAQMSLLFQSIGAWNKAIEFVRKAKDAQGTDAEAYAYGAAIWRMKHEIYQALYFVGVRP